MAKPGLGGAGRAGGAGRGLRHTPGRGRAGAIGHPEPSITGGGGGGASPAPRGAAAGAAREVEAGSGGEPRYRGAAGGRSRGPGAGHPAPGRCHRLGLGGEAGWSPELAAKCGAAWRGRGGGGGLSGQGVDKPRGGCGGGRRCSGGRLLRRQVPALRVGVARVVAVTVSGWWMYLSPEGAETGLTLAVPCLSKFSFATREQPEGKFLKFR